MNNIPNNNVNGAVVPYNNYPYQQGGQPPIIQPVIQPIVQQPMGQLIPVPYPGHNTAMDYLGGVYPPPPGAYGGYSDYGMYPRGLRGSPQVYIPRRRKGRMARMMEALFLGGEVDRLRMLEMQAGMGEYGYGMGGAYGARGMGMMDDGYGYGYSARGMRGYGSGYHGRGCRCPECMEDYY